MSWNASGALRLGLGPPTQGSSKAYELSPQVSHKVDQRAAALL